jgi:hypothetical protein
MQIDVTEEAAEFGRVARQALESAGGDQLVQWAEVEPERREVLVAPVLAELGAWELEPRTSADDLEAAATLCRSAGWWAVPYPVAERLCRPTDSSAVGQVVVADVSPSATLAGLAGEWRAVALDGHRYAAVPRASSAGPRATGFVSALDLRPLPAAPDDADRAYDVALGLVLPCWTLLGMLDRAIDLTSTYVLEREQFGQPLSTFQGVQFQLTDAEVERSGVEELARYALWSIEAQRDDVVADALALRLAALEAAEIVFRVAHQLHAAIGFCDETTLSWLSRYSQPLRRLPLGRSATSDELARRVGRDGLSGLFDAGDAWSAAP